jgi:anthranilate phosphoribosyltransferase
VLEALGVRVGLEPEAAERVLRETGIAFLFAPTHHPAMRHVGAARKAIGRRTIFNLLGPLASPARVTRQLAGVFSADWLVPYAQALAALGAERALIVHGRDGLDEVSVSEATQTASLAHGAVDTLEITPEQAGLPRHRLADIVGGDAAHNAAALTALLDGKVDGAYRDIVLLNAAAALMVADAASDIKSGVARAAELLDSGAARGKLNALIEASQS